MGMLFIFSTGNRQYAKLIEACKLEPLYVDVCEREIQRESFIYLLYTNTVSNLICVHLYFHARDCNLHLISTWLPGSSS